MSTIVPIKFLDNNAMCPSRGSDKAAGYDLYANLGVESFIIPVGETAKVGTGIAVSIPDNYFGGIFARSGLATKQGLRPANCVGVIDSDYTGEIIVALHNDSDEPRVIHNHDRIAQLVIMPFLSVEFSQVDELTETERGSGGFGSTGINAIKENNHETYEQLSLFDKEYKSSEDCYTTTADLGA